MGEGGNCPPFFPRNISNFRVFTWIESFHPHTHSTIVEIARCVGYSVSIGVPVSVRLQLSSDAFLLCSK